MSFFDKIRDIMSATDEDDDFEEESYSSKNDDVQGDGYYASRRPQREKTTQFSSERTAERRSSARPSAGTVRTAAQLQVALVKPERYEDAPSVADHIKDGRTVVLNLEVAPRDVQRRLIDFLSGAAYAHNGNIKKIANNTFIITPDNVDVMGELLLDELSETSFY